MINRAGKEGLGVHSDIVSVHGDFHLLDVYMQKYFNLQSASLSLSLSVEYLKLYLD